MKRTSNNSHNINCEKRFKPNNFNNLWDDDPEIDDYLILASQICEEQNQENTTVIPGYNTFNGANILCSTQVNNQLCASNRPSTSSFRENYVDKRFLDLQKQYESKEGEATILRTQLNQTKEVLEHEKLKKTLEIQTEIKSLKQNSDKYRTQLEFANLEISNLKRKLQNLTKNNTLDVSIAQSKNVCSTICHDPSFTLTSAINSSINEDFSLNFQAPLTAKLIPESFFKSVEDDKFPEIKRQSQRDEPYMGSLLFPKTSFKRPNKRFSIKMIHPEIINLIQNFNDNQPATINKILLLALNLVSSHVKYLREMEGFLTKQEIREMDFRNLQPSITSFDVQNKCLYSSKPWILNEAGIHCRQCLSIISTFLPMNRYLAGVFVNNGPLIIKDNSCEEFLKALKAESVRNLVIEKQECVNFANIWWENIFSLVKLIGNVRQGNSYVGFLSALCQFLSKSLQVHSNPKSEICSLLFKITNQIVMTLPQNVLLYFLADLFKTVSVISPFVEMFCEKPTKSLVVSKDSKEIFLINPKCCTFEVFALLVQQVMEKLDDSTRLDLLHFISNLFYCNVSWLNHDETFHYDCKKYCFDLITNIILISIRRCRKCRNNNEDIPSDLRNIIKIGTQLLSLCNYKFSELLESYTHLNVKFKSCIKTLLNMKDFDFGDFNVTTLEKLSLDEASQ